VGVEAAMSSPGSDVSIVMSIRFLLELDKLKPGRLELEISKLMSSSLSASVPIRLSPPSGPVREMSRRQEMLGKVELYEDVGTLRSWLSVARGGLDLGSGTQRGKGVARAPLMLESVVNERAPLDCSMVALVSNVGCGSERAPLDCKMVALVSNVGCVSVRALMSNVVGLERWRH